MNLKDYDNKIIRLWLDNGKVLTGEASFISAEFGMHEFGREEDGLQLSGYTFFESDFEKIEILSNFEVIRAEETWQQAGAYYVRTQAMAKKHHISLRQEFDEHDTPETKYIVVTDEEFPIATARMYPLDESSVMIGRVVVLPEYRHLGIGTMVVTECEAWAEELGFSKSFVESRDNKIEFYDQLGYEICGEPIQGDTFRCIRMKKVF